MYSRRHVLWLLLRAISSCPVWHNWTLVDPLTKKNTMLAYLTEPFLRCAASKPQVYQIAERSSFGSTPLSYPMLFIFWSWPQCMGSTSCDVCVVPLLLVELTWMRRGDHSKFFFVPTRVGRLAHGGCRKASMADLERCRSK